MRPDDIDGMTPAEIVQFYEEQQKRDWHLAWWTAALTRTDAKGWPKSAADIWAERPSAPKVQSIAQMRAGFEMLKARMEGDKNVAASRRTRMQKE